MTKLTLTASMPKRFESGARKVFQCVDDGFYEVSAGKDWIRVSIVPRNSIYFAPLQNGKVIVNIEGGAIGTYLDHAIYYWGEPYYRYYDQKQKKEYLKWRIESNDFYSHVKNVMKRKSGFEDDTTLIETISLIYSDDNLRSFEKLALAKQRIGHSSFARKVKSRANNSCVLNPVIKRNLIASHIKPWAKAEDYEKVDIFNGLCLSPNYDSLFEDGIISFHDDGSIMVGCLNQDEMRAYNLNGSEKIPVLPEQCRYLAWHRENKFIKKLDCVEDSCLTL